MLYSSQSWLVMYDVIFTYRIKHLVSGIEPASLLFRHINSELCKFWVLHIVYKQLPVSDNSCDKNYCFRVFAELMMHDVFLQEDQS